MARRTRMILILGLFILGLSGIVFAQTETQPQAAQDTGIVANEAVNVGNKICPVSGEKIGEGMEAVTYEYEGKIYNFCCAMCIDEFKKEPQKYIKIVEEELQKEKAEAKTEEPSEAHEHAGHSHMH